MSPATATDDSGATPTISYSPTSFGVGTTTVTWTATDAAGNTATTTSQVAVYLSVNVSVDVPSSCTVTDSDGVQHSYNATSSTAYIGICAVQAAIDQGAVNAIFSNAFPTLGLFVTTLNTVAADPSSQFWALYQNGGFASLGLSALPVSTGDTLKLELHDFSDNPQGDQLSVTITSLVASSTLSASSTPAVIVQGGGGGGFSHLTFSVPNAIGFLTSKQGANGSFADDRLTDWAALAYAVADQSTAKQLLTNYLTASNPLLVTLTDYERHAMALEALGINPYTGTTIDTITPIVSAFDGTKLSSLVNINIFALFPLLHAGYSASDTMIQKIVAYILSQQSADGSWSDPDTTSAAIQALAPLNSLPGVNDALAKGRTFLRSIQNSNGSIGGQNLEFQTAWALQAIAALGENQLNWTAPSYDPLDYLASIQQTDGGVDSVTVDASTRVWATEYAIPAAAGKPWGTLLMNFSKPANAVPGTTSTTASTTVATSTAPTATSTPIIASSTPAVATTTTVSAPAAPTPETAPLISAPPTTPQAPQPPVAATPVAPTPDDAITAANTQLAAAGVIGIDYGSWWFLLLLILLAIFLAVLGWSLTNAWQNRRRS